MLVLCHSLHLLSRGVNMSTMLMACDGASDTARPAMSPSRQYHHHNITYPFQCQLPKHNFLATLHSLNFPKVSFHRINLNIAHRCKHHSVQMFLKIYFFFVCQVNVRVSSWWPGDGGGNNCVTYLSTSPPPQPPQPDILTNPVFALPAFL